MKVTKTIKMLVGGDFVRSESGETFTLQNTVGDNNQPLRYCQASPKDLRNAISVAGPGQIRWSSLSSYLRAQILYRMAEMTSGRSSELVSLLSAAHPSMTEASQEMVAALCDTMVFYAGFADKFSQVVSCLNPVSGPFSHSSGPVPVGVVVLLDGDEADPLRFVDALCGILAGGNSVTAIPGAGNHWLLAPLSEIIATSDVPAGAVNLLSARTGALDEVIARHHEVRAIAFTGEDPKRLKNLRTHGVCNLKRIQQLKEKKVLENITGFTEVRSVWETLGY